MSTTIAQPSTSWSTAILDWSMAQTVSVVIPCYNEEKFIGKALENLVNQYPSESYEIVVVDGMSTDRTRDVVKQFQIAHPSISVILIDNPARTIPQALNLGIAAAHGEIIARVDAHASPSSGYIRRCVDVLQQQKSAVVGMPCQVKPGAKTAMARAIATAVSRPFGIGDAKYRLVDEKSQQQQEEVDTVAFACFKKSLWSELGGFNEELLTNEDYDFNYRVRQHGSKVILDRAEHCDYFARPDLKSLATQYLRYGFWKAQMVKRQPRSLKLRHLVAPGFVATSAMLALLGLMTSLAWYVLTAVLFTYFSAAIFSAARASALHDDRLRIGAMLPIVFFTIHLCWGTSFLFGLVKPPRG